MQENGGLINEKLTLDGRKRLTLTSVNSVDGFTDRELMLTVSGTKVEIKGQNIKISVYNNVSGNLTADGTFTEIKFGAKKTPFFKRVFK